jgi:hypothetical protein
VAVEAMATVTMAHKSRTVNHSTSRSKTNDGICAALKRYSFDCDAPGSANQANMTLEKMTDHLGITLGNDILVKLETRQQLVTPNLDFPASNPGEIKASKARKMAQSEQLKKAWTARTNEINIDDQLMNSGTGLIEKSWKTRSNWLRKKPTSPAF